MRLKSRFTCTFTHTCCFYSGSTHPHTSTPFHLQIHLKLFYSYLGENSPKHYPIPVIPREINALDILVTTTCYIILGGWVLWKKRENKYEEIKSQNRPNYKSSSVETIDKQSSFQTWAHINPVVNWNHEGLQTNLQQTKIVIIQHNTANVT